MMMSFLSTGMQTTVAYIACTILLIKVVNSVESFMLCEANSVRIENAGESGFIHLDLSTNNGTVYNPCIMKIESCSTCQIKIDPVPRKDFEFFCKTGVLQNSYCSIGCDYLHIFDMYYMNETRTAKYYKNWTDFNEPFVSESSNIFIMLCHGLTGRYNFSLTYHTIKKVMEKTGTYENRTLQHGTILSPFFPRGYYLNHEVYEYIIKGLQEQDRILLIFDDWHLDSSSALYYEDGSKEGSYTGAVQRPSIVTVTNTLRFVFHTGEALSPTYGRSYMGFKASYSFHSSLSIIQKPVTICKNSGYFLNQVGGHIEFSHSSDRAQLYDCVWVVKRQPGYTEIFLKIATMRLVGYGKGGFIVVRAGLTSDSRVVGNVSLTDNLRDILPYHEQEGFYIRITATLSSGDKVELAYASHRKAPACHRDPGMFECDDSRQCISDSLKCDGYDHCGDNSDEDKACGVYTPPWDESYQYTITIGVIVPMVISVFLVMVICLLFVLIRRCRRQRLQDTTAADRIQTLSEDVSPTREPENRRRRRRRRRMFNSATDRDHPPTYDEAIQSPPSWYHNVGFNNPADPSLPQPPPYSEVGDNPQAMLTNHSPESPTSSHSSQSELTIDSRRHSVSSSSSDGGFRGWNDQENTMEGRRGRIGRHISSSYDSDEDVSVDRRTPQRSNPSTNHYDQEPLQTGSSTNVVSSENNSTKQKDKNQKNSAVERDTRKTSSDKDVHIEPKSMDISIDGDSKNGEAVKQGSCTDKGRDQTSRNAGAKKSGRDPVSNTRLSPSHCKTENEPNGKPSRQTNADVTNIEMMRFDSNITNNLRPSLSQQRGISRSVGSLVQNQGPTLAALMSGTRRSLAAQTLSEEEPSLTVVVDVDTNEMQVVNSAADGNQITRRFGAPHGTVENSSSPLRSPQRVNNSPARSNGGLGRTNYHPRMQHDTRSRTNNDSQSPYLTSSLTSSPQHYPSDRIGARSENGHNSAVEPTDRGRGRDMELMGCENPEVGEEALRTGLPDTHYDGQGCDQPLGRTRSVNYIPLFIDGNPEDDVYV